MDGEQLHDMVDDAAEVRHVHGLTDEALASALRFMASAYRVEGLGAPDIAPVEGGGIMYEWNTEKGFLKAEVLYDGYIESHYGRKGEGGDKALANPYDTLAMMRPFHRLVSL